MLDPDQRQLHNPLATTVMLTAGVVVVRVMMAFYVSLLAIARMSGWLANLARQFHAGRDFR